MEHADRKTEFVLSAALRLHKDGMAAPAQEDLPWCEEETNDLMGIALDVAAFALRMVEGFEP